MPKMIPIMALMLFFLCLGCKKEPGKTQENLPTCLIVSSYHKEYAWQQGLEKGFRPVLKGKCASRYFYMDTKRNPAPEFCGQKALEAKALIESLKPAVVIASDDNASKYLVQPYYKDADLPFVFCGVNWSVKEYGYPYSNVTGMIEVVAIKPLITQAKRIVPGARRIACITSNTLTELKVALRVKEIYRAEGVKFTNLVATNMADFKRVYKQAQGYDYILFWGYVGIKDWDDAAAKDFIGKHSKKLTIGLNRWSYPYVMLVFNIVPEEQGRYAAEAALKILEGTKPADIPIIANHEWNIIMNEALLDIIKIKLPGDLRRKAKRVE
ncbi:MAG: hypothetical protein GY754_04735 [bacterium]|nr:hypothetical protein [bacterium]